MDPDGTRELIEKQDLSIETRNIGLVESDHTHVLTIKGKGSVPPNNYDTYIIVDLTNFNKDSLSMYLAFCDAFDFMLENKHLIHKWVTCFSINGQQAFSRFTQKILDSLLCKTFEYDNVKDLHSIVLLLSFYKFGTIDKKFDIKISSFGRMQFMVPKTIEDACKAAAMYNVYPIVKNVLGKHGSLK